MRKGFTLIELLIVIAILAILATVVVLVLNPTQLLAESRDSQRLSDMQTLNAALSLYGATASTVDLDGSGSGDCPTDCFVYESTGVAANCGGRHDAARATTEIQTTDAQKRDIDGDGWIPVNLGNASGGSPLSVLPVDPVNNTTGCSGSAGCFYSYACSNTATTWEVNANLESTRYTSGTDNKEDADGGNVATIYEIGNDPILDL